MTKNLRRAAAILLAAAALIEAVEALRGSDAE